MNNEKGVERREILMLEKEKKYTIYDFKRNTTEWYKINNRQFQKYRVVKFYKGNGAVNYLGKRNNKFKGIIIKEVKGKEENQKK